MAGSEPTGASPGPSLEDVVRRHAPGLHRTALMLTGDAAHADRLVTEVFRRAAGVWGPGAQIGSRPLHDALLHELVRAHLRHARARRRDELDPPEGWATQDAGDLLSSVQPPGRAAAVLKHAEGWSSGRIAEALRVQRGKVAYLLPRAEGLRTALEGLADQHARPAEEVVSTVLARLSTAGRPAPGTGRAWTWRWLAAAVALGLVVWLTTLGDTTGRDPAASQEPSPVTGTTLALLDGTLLPTGGGDLAARGWVLDEAGLPPVDLEGLRLLEAVPIDLRRATAPLRLDTRPRAGAAVFAVLWCDLPTLDPNVQVPAARLGMGGETTTLPCAGSGGEPAVERLTPLPPAAGEGRRTALVSWTGDVPGRGRALLATYTEVGAVPSPSSGEPSPVPPVADAGTVVLGGTSAAYQVGDRLVHHQRVRIGPGSAITVWAGGVGEISVQVEDVVVTDDGDAAGGMVPPEEEATCESVHGGTGTAASSTWRRADPELRDGRWLVYRPGRARVFEVPEEVRPGHGEQRTVTVAVSTSLDRRSWQVHVGAAEVVAEVGPPLALVGSVTDLGDDVPVWVGGYRLAAAWRVPNDGVPHRLVDPGLRPGRRFVLVDTPPGAERGAWGVVVPHVATTRGPADLAVVGEVPDAFDETVWQRGDRLVRAGASTQSILAGSGTGVLSVTAPAAAGQTPPSTLLAYEPVPYEDFDFAAAPPMGVSTPVDEVAAGPAGSSPAETVVVDRFTREDLDEDGVLTIDTELTGRTWLRLTTEGRGRVQILEGGRPAVWLADGWWTSWTAAPVVTEVRVVGTRGSAAPRKPFELRVEGYAEGFTVEVLSRDGGDEEPGST